jgi:putative transposase
LHDRVSRSDVPRVDISEAKRLKALEDENGRLKKLLADAMLDNSALKDLLGKKW